MDILDVLTGAILGGGGGGIIGIAWNWYTFRKEWNRSEAEEIDRRRVAVLESMRRQATSAEQRGDRAERDRILTQMEAEETALQAQLKAEVLSPDRRIRLE